MIQLNSINKRYLHEHVLDNITCTLPDTGFVSLIGPSGCGKSTLLHIIAGLDHDYSGEVIYKDKKISIIFQDFHLIPWLSITNNIRLYDYFHKSSYSLDNTLTQQFKKTPVSALSLGQRQRTAIERALYYDPNIILCDEPTASLDPDNAEIVLKKLKERSHSSLVLFVSHDEASVKQYSDRIIEMKDGYIIKDTVIQKTEIYPKENHSNNKRYHFPILKLTIQSFLSSRKRFFQMSFALSIALLCLMMTFTFTFSFRDTIFQYLSSLIPQKSITYKLHNDDPLPLTHFNEASYHYLNLDDYSLMGISHNNQRYQKNEVLFISDDTSYETHYIYGRAPQNNDEIAVPLSTARKLSQNKKVDSLLNTSWTIYYKYQLKIKGIEVKIVGISPQTYNYDAFYMYEYANYHWIESIFNQTPTARYGMLKYKEDKSIIDSLKKNHPEYEFKTMGESTKKTFNDNMNRIQTILVVFSILTILSSIFMIMEIMILHAMHLKKDHAIMKAYGEKKKHIFKMSFYQCLILHSYSYLTASLILLGIMKVMNQIIPQITDFPMRITFQPLIMFLLWIGSFLLVCISTLFSVIYIIKLNPSHILKMR